MAAGFVGNGAAGGHRSGIDADSRGHDHIGIGVRCRAAVRDQRGLSHDRDQSADSCAVDRVLDAGLKL